MVFHYRVRRSSTACKTARPRNRLLRVESLEPLVLLSGSGVAMMDESLLAPPIVGANKAPTISKSIVINNNSYVTGKTAALSVLGADDAGESKLKYTWSVVSAPTGGTATFSVNGTNAAKNTIATFTMAGSYTFMVKIVDAGNLSVSSSRYVDVYQTCSAITLSPNTPYVLLNAAQQFTPKALDQFNQIMANQQAFTWSCTAGKISNFGLFTAPSSGTSCKVTAKSGSVTCSATVTLLANPGTIQNAALANLVGSLDADGSISRADMIQILKKAGTDGVVDATEFADFKQILYQATTLNIPDYVQALAGDVVNGNFANATYLGKPLGNLTIGSSATQLNNLVNKWFYGTDHPALCNASLTYKSVSGTLFPQNPSHNDEYQGALGDCYFISALGTLADCDQNSVRNMFVDNNDGTYTVRFYTGTYGTIYNYQDGSIGAGFNNNVGYVDYITVDRYLPVTSAGMLAYAGYGAMYYNSNNSLWIPLAEKAYAQWNETGKEGRDGLNAYASIQGGWMATVDAQVLGHNATDYIMSTVNEQVIINAINSKKAVTVGTLSWSGTNYGLYPNHAYAIIGYSASTRKYTLYNPWGSNQPAALTWAQLKSSCSQCAVADATGSLPIAGKPVVASSTIYQMLGNIYEAASRESRRAGPAMGDLSVAAVDAVFAIDGGA
jgi:hypothetical protein